MGPFEKKKHPAPALFPTNSVATSPAAVLWDRDGGLLRFGLPWFRRQRHHFFLPFLHVLFLSFPKVCLWYNGLLLKKLTVPWIYGIEDVVRKALKKEISCVRYTQIYKYIYICSFCEGIHHKHQMPHDLRV